MAKYESKVKQIPYAQSSVYAKMADLTHLLKLKDAVGTPAAAEMLNGKITEDQQRQARELLDGMEATPDSLSVQLPMVGAVTLNIVERDEPKCVKFQSTQSPIPVTMWVQLLPTDASSCKMRLTLDADLNMMMKMMLGGKLKDGIDKFADMLASLPYE